MKLWAKAACVGVVIGIGAGCLAYGLQPQVRSLPGPVDPQPPRLTNPAPATSVPTTSGTTSSTTTTVPASPPVSLQIPEIGVSVALTAPLGLNPDGTVSVPTGTAQPAWYSGSPDPGQQGSSILLGHVDSKAGPGIFFNLRELVPGNTLTVTLADGHVDTFQVLGTGQYPKSNFPTALVYNDHGYAGLNLVTCGGVFDPATGHYLSNIVVFTKEVNAPA